MHDIVEKPIVVSEMKDGRFQRFRKMFVDLYFPIINEKYHKKVMNGMTTQEQKILSLFIGKESIDRKVKTTSDSRLSFWYNY